MIGTMPGLMMPGAALVGEAEDVPVLTRHPGAVMIEVSASRLTAGTVLRTTAYFTDATTNDAANPTEVTLTYVIGSNTPVPIKWGVPGGIMVHPIEGEYYVDLDTSGWVTTDQLVVLQWAGEGAVQVVAEVYVVVSAPAATPSYA
jgi:hypothetical protein